MRAGVREGKMVSDSLEVDLQVVCQPTNVGAGNQTQLLCKSKDILLPAEPFPQASKTFLIFSLDKHYFKIVR